MLEDPLPGDGRWAPGDVLLTGESDDEVLPILACELGGTLWAVFETPFESASPWLARSEDGGLSWTPLIGLTGGAANPPLTLAEGNQSWLLLAYEFPGGQIRVMRVNPHDHLDYDITILVDHPPGVANPRTTTDQREFPSWYGYIVYNALGPDGWTLMLQVTQDYGNAWRDWQTIGTYCGSPPYYDARQSRPDIAFGAEHLYVAFANPVTDCQGDRDIFVLISDNYGSSFRPAVHLAHSVEDECHPEIGAFTNETEAATAVVSYTRFWDAGDLDVWYRYTQDAGLAWSPSHCLACAINNEKWANLETSRSRGYVHAAFWDENDVKYTRARYLDPIDWSESLVINGASAAAADYARPGITADPTEDQTEEVCVAWTDERNAEQSGFDIYFDRFSLSAGVDDEDAG